MTSRHRARSQHIQKHLHLQKQNAKSSVYFVSTKKIDKKLTRVFKYQHNMAGYTKLFSSILASTIWRADDKTRIVWITLLAMSDKNGVAEASVPGLADLARVSLKDCLKALKTLQEPDSFSRTKTNEGRRIEEVDGGWRIINHAKYRAKMNADERREYNRTKQSEYRAAARHDAPASGVSGCRHTPMCREASACTSRKLQEMR